jgi:hypothetical protein
MGIVAAFFAAVSSPFMFILYGRIAGTFVDYKKFEYFNSMNFSNNKISTMPFLEQLNYSKPSN